MDVWGRVAPRYDAFIRRFLARQYAEMIRRVGGCFTEDKVVLEIGAGTGIISLAIAPGVKHLTATDISPQMLAVAAKKAGQKGVENVSFVLGAGEKLPVAAGIFDGCLMINVLHVVTDPHACLREARRILRPAGLLVLATFCHGEGWRAKFVSLAMRMVTGVSFHRLTTAAVAAAVATAGFYVLEKRHLGGVLPLLFLVARPCQQIASVPEATQSVKWS